MKKLCIHGQDEYHLCGCEIETGGNGHTDICKKSSNCFPILDDSTTYVEIQTPENWKCDRANCSTDFKHTHTNYGFNA